MPAGSGTPPPPRAPRRRCRSAAGSRPTAPRSSARMISHGSFQASRASGTAPAAWVGLEHRDHRRLVAQAVLEVDAHVVVAGGRGELRGQRAGDPGPQPERGLPRLPLGTQALARRVRRPHRANGKRYGISTVGAPRPRRHTPRGIASVENGSSPRCRRRRPRSARRAVALVRPRRVPCPPPPLRSRPQLDQRRHQPRRARPDERLPRTRARHRHVAVGPGAGADHGESPTRPGRWPWSPPVDVAAASRPLASRHTAPTVAAVRAAEPRGQAPALALGHELRWIALLEAARRGERIGALRRPAAPALVEQRGRRGHGMPGAPHYGDRAGRPV